MEGLPMVSYSRGSMNSLLQKLTELMKNSTSEIQGLPQAHVEGLLKDLEILNGRFFDKLAGRQELDGQVKAWMKQVRQLVVDIEDWVDTKLLNMKELEIGSFEDFILQIDETCERCTRYELLKAPTDPAVHVDVVPSNEFRRQLPEKPVGLVGIGGPIEEIVKVLTEEQESLKVVSIVGMEGLGKTTLAKAIDAKLRWQFDCQAFVSVGRRTTFSTILMDIFHDDMPVTSLAMHVTDLRKWLHKKRYLIIIDGLWSTWEWKVINCALPDNNCGSRVLITTCIMNVAKSCCIHRNDIIYQMKTLSKLDSENIFGGEAKGPSEDDILKICGGMPLAIIVAAGLLSSKTAGLAEPKMPWKLDSTSEGMNKILYMSYADLSLPLKSCFMYLNVFPEEYTIEKDRLIRLWRAEGFIPRSHEESMWVIGERYFNELISRRLIQPVFSYENGQVVGCTVHGVILDFMASLSREENLVTVGAELKPGPLDKTLPWSLTATPGTELTPGPFLCYETVRRLSLRRRGGGDGDNLVSSNVHLSRVRSLIVFRNPFGLPDLQAFKLIRVLDLEGYTKTISYNAISRLFLLRYLGLAGTSVASKDMQNIGELKYLQTLDVRGTMVSEFPSHLPNLVTVLGNGLKFSRFPSEHTGQDLEELSDIDAQNDVTRNVVSELLVRSKKLRILCMQLFGINRGNIMPFLDTLRRSELESLSMLSMFSHIRELDEWAPSPKLRKYQLIRLLPRVPESWAELDSLTHLDIRVQQIKTRDFLVLGKLPKLIFLKFESWLWGVSESIVGGIGFQNLEVLNFSSVGGETRLRYEQGAMPKLQKLQVCFDTVEIVKQRGIQFPPNLMEVHIVFNRYSDRREAIEIVKSVIRYQISIHPNPNISLEFFDL